MYILCLASGLALTNSLMAQSPTPAPQAAPRQTQTTTTITYPPTLYQMNDVSKSLNLTQDQINRLNKLTDQTQARYRDKYNELTTVRDADRFARAQELNRQYYSDWNKGARDIFNDNQRSRYQQYLYQYGGFNTLYDPAVQKRLSLTPTPIKKLREKADWSNQRLEEINRMAATDPAKGRQVYRDYWAQRQQRLSKFLTPEQQRAWRDMTGEVYSFQPAFSTTPPRQ